MDNSQTTITNDILEFRELTIRDSNAIVPFANPTVTDLSSF